MSIKNTSKTRLDTESRNRRTDAGERLYTDQPDKKQSDSSDCYNLLYICWVPALIKMKTNYYSVTDMGWSVQTLTNYHFVWEMPVNRSIVSLMYFSSLESRFIANKSYRWGISTQLSHSLVFCILVNKVLIKLKPKCCDGFNTALNASWPYIW